MNLKPIINEMRAYWLKGQTGGQLLIGGHEAHYNTDKTPAVVIECVKESCTRPSPLSVLLWEVEAIEKDNIIFYEFVAYFGF